MENQSFDDNVRENKRKLAHLCTKLCGNYEDAADLYQETLLKAYAKYGLYNSALPFDRWICSVCVNTYKNFARSKRRQIRLVDFQTNEDKDFVISNVANPEPDDPDEIYELHRAVDTLKTKYKTVIVLFYMNGYMIDEISNMTGIPQGTVKNRLFQAREILKRRLTENEKNNR